MNWIAEQPYYKVERTVSEEGQQAIKQHRRMYLHEDKIVTKHRQFPLRDVFDLSYRPIGQEEGGLLYLHTGHGVYSYTVLVDPQPFIDAYKALTPSRSGE